MAKKPTHYILITEENVSVKGAEFFVEQGGLKQKWGKCWKPVVANSLYDARNKALKARRKAYPSAFKLLGERGEKPEDYWPEARGQ